MPKTPPGPAAIVTMSSPNDEIGVSSETDVIGAMVSIVAVVFSETTTVPRSAFVGVGAAVNIGLERKRRHHRRHETARLQRNGPVQFHVATSA